MNVHGVKVYLVTRLKDWGWGLSLVVIQHQLVDGRLLLLLV